MKSYFFPRLSVENKYYATLKLDVLVKFKELGSSYVINNSRLEVLYALLLERNWRYRNISDVIVEHISYLINLIIHLFIQSLYI